MLTMIERLLLMTKPRFLGTVPSLKMMSLAKIFFLSGGAIMLSVGAILRTAKRPIRFRKAFLAERSCRRLADQGIYLPLQSHQLSMHLFYQCHHILHSWSRRQRIAILRLFVHWRLSLPLRGRVLFGSDGIIFGEARVDYTIINKDRHLFFIRLRGATKSHLFVTIFLFRGIIFFHR